MDITLSIILIWNVRIGKEIVLFDNQLFFLLQFQYEQEYGVRSTK